MYNFFVKFGLLVLALSTATISNAATISSTPIFVGAPFTHNVFHTASGGSDGESGTILAWFNINSGGGSWDGSSGSFNLSVDLFANSADAMAQTNLVGTATSTGTLKLSDLRLAGGGSDATAGGLFGSITWTFDNAAAAVLGSGVALDASNSITLYFEDRSYGSTGANTWAGNNLTLWGADGWDGTDLVVSTNTLGMDLVATVVPVPAAVWLFGSGLLGLAGVARRRQLS